jgi:hypothetical protein
VPLRYKARLFSVSTDGWVWLVVPGGHCNIAGVLMYYSIEWKIVTNNALLFYFRVKDHHSAVFVLPCYDFF